MKYTLATFLASASVALAAPRTNAPAGCSTVSPSGGDFTTVQAAVSAAGAGGCIFLDQGLYPEQVLINGTQDLTIYGYTTDDTSYAHNGATIYAGLSQDLRINNDGTGTLRVHAPNFKLYNVNVHNTRSEGSQAVALSAQNTSAYYGCSFKGYQDTVLTNELQQLYVDCEIVGATDFIFGQRSFAWFERVDIRLLRLLNETEPGWVTANGAAAAGTSKYVFNNCDIAAARNESVVDGSYFLGRPWRAYANVVFQNTSMSRAINQQGWSPWSATQPLLENVTFAEYASSGDGAVGQRANFTTFLDAPVAIEEVLGANYTSMAWFDPSCM